MQLGIVDLRVRQMTINPYRPQFQLEEGVCASNASSGRLSWPRPTVKYTDRAVQTGQPPHLHNYAERRTGAVAKTMKKYSSRAVVTGDKIVVAAVAEEVVVEACWVDQNMLSKILCMGNSTNST